MKNLHNFILKRKTKLITKEIPLIFGIAGIARCGKDTLAKHLTLKFERMEAIAACGLVAFESSIHLISSFSKTNSILW